MLGFASVADAVGTSMSALYDDPATASASSPRCASAGGSSITAAGCAGATAACIDVIETVVGEFDAGGALTELRGFLIDVTASVEAELALLERERQFRAVFFDAADAMLILDDRRVDPRSEPGRVRAVRRRRRANQSASRSTSC